MDWIRSRGDIRSGKEEEKNNGLKKKKKKITLDLHAGVPGVPGLEFGVHSAL
jgi:hypothetical protein